MNMNIERTNTVISFIERIGFIDEWFKHAKRRPRFFIPKYVLAMDMHTHVVFSDFAFFCREASKWKSIHQPNKKNGWYSHTAAFLLLLLHNLWMESKKFQILLQPEMYNIVRAFLQTSSFFPLDMVKLKLLPKTKFWFFVLENYL